VREYTYAYGGACPHDGVLDSLILPTMHSECFDLFAAEISRRHPDELVIMVCDGAGSHTATDLSLPVNVRILTLPPYGPELNPTEGLWDPIREDASPTKHTTLLTKSRTTLPRSYRSSKRPLHHSISHQSPMDHIITKLDCGLVREVRQSPS
jgi:hypothetical protein